MASDSYDEIKKLALIAMVSNDALMSQLVLKGGNLLDIVYGVADRSSLDMDFSMETDFAPEFRASVEKTVKQLLRETFRPNGYEVFDISFTERPEVVSEEMKAFWGGYRLEFKVIDGEVLSGLTGDPQEMRRHAAEIGPDHHRTFRVEISKFEYCAPKRPRKVEGYQVYVYTPEMMVFEKLRAICQQMPEYAEVVANPSRSGRARDFFDIHTLIESFTMDLAGEKNKDLLQKIFHAKRVPLHLIGLVRKYREFHRHDFVSVESTVKPGVRLQEFDYYFDFVVENCCDPLKPLWEE